MDLPFKLLSEIQHSVSSSNQDIDQLVYTDKLKKYSLPSIIDFDYKTILDPPPPNSSEQTVEELIKISYLTSNRSNKDIQMIKAIDDDPAIGIKNLCRSKGIEFDSEYFNKWYESTKDLIYAIKSYHNRPRPYQLAEIYSIKIDLMDSETAKTPAYPSGHTVYTALAAHLVIDNYPELKDILYRIVMTTAYARCAMGVHYPSDNTASIILAEYIYKQLKLKI